METNQINDDRPLEKDPEYEFNEWLAKKEAGFVVRILVGAFRNLSTTHKYEALSHYLNEEDFSELKEELQILRECEQ